MGQSTNPGPPEEKQAAAFSETNFTLAVFALETRGSLPGAWVRGTRLAFARTTLLACVRTIAPTVHVQWSMLLGV